MMRYIHIPKSILFIQIIIAQYCCAQSDTLIFQIDSAKVKIIQKEGGVSLMTEQIKTCGYDFGHEINMDLQGRLRSISFHDNFCDSSLSQFYPYFRIDGKLDSVFLPMSLNYLLINNSDNLSVFNIFGQDLTDFVRKGINQKRNLKNNNGKPSDFLGTGRFYNDSLTWFAVSYDSRGVVSLSELSGSLHQLNGIRLFCHGDRVTRITFYKFDNKHLAELIFNKKGRLKYIFILEDGKYVHRLKRPFNELD